MAQFLMAAVVILAVLVAVMALALWRLALRVRGLVAQVEVMRPDVDSAGAVRWSRQARPPGEATQATGAAARPPVQDVSVITRLSDVTEPGDLTTGRVASVVLAAPLIKVAAFSAGLRRALDDEHRLRMRLAFRRELRRQRKARRRAVRTASVEGGGS
jgi:hypothetical protein